MRSICGADCDNCSFKKNNGCLGCTEAGCCPFGKKCFVAEYIKTGGMSSFEQFKKQLTDEINSLNIVGMSPVNELYPLCGWYINLEYPLPGGNTVKLLDDKEIYLGCQVECEFNDAEAKRCFGVIANAGFIAVAEYGDNGSDPQLIIYKKR